MNAPPPRPELCGSTSPSTACITTAASAAAPPACRTRMPACAASGLAATTIACGPGDAFVVAGNEADADEAAGDEAAVLGGAAVRQACTASNANAAAAATDRTREG